MLVSEIFQLPWTHTPSLSLSLMYIVLIFKHESNYVLLCMCFWCYCADNNRLKVQSQRTSIRDVYYYYYYEVREVTTEGARSVYIYSPSFPAYNYVSKWNPGTHTYTVQSRSFKSSVVSPLVWRWTVMVNWSWMNRTCFLLLLLFCCWLFIFYSWDSQTVKERSQNHFSFTTAAPELAVLTVHRPTYFLLTVLIL